MSSGYQFYSSQATQHPGGEEYCKRHHHFSGHDDLFREEGMFPSPLDTFTTMLMLLSPNYRSFLRCRHDLG